MKTIHFYLFLLVLLLFSCGENTLEPIEIENSISSNELTLEDRDHLSLLGFNPDEVVPTKNYFIYQNDIAILKKDIYEAVSNNKGKEKARIQKLGAGLNVISAANYAIKYYISPSFDNDNGPECQQTTETKRNLILEAIDDWDNISQSALSFSETTDTSQADLIIAMFGDAVLPEDFLDGVGGFTCALGEYPSNNKIGRYIGVNSICGFVRSTNDQDYRSAIAHEIGHNLGYYHIDDSDPDSQYAGCSSLSGSCSNTLMAAPCCGETRSINTDELNVLRRMYPTNYQTISINSHNISPQSATTRIVQLNLAYNTNKPFRIRVHRFHPFNFFTPTHTDELFCNASSYSVEAPLGTWGFKIEYLNYMSDKSTISNLYTVNVQ